MIAAYCRGNFKVCAVQLRLDLCSDGRRALNAPLRHSIFNYGGNGCKSKGRRQGRRHIFGDRRGDGAGQCNAFSRAVRALRRRLSGSLRALPRRRVPAYSRCGTLFGRKIPRALFGLRKAFGAKVRSACARGGRQCGIYGAVLRRRDDRDGQFRPAGRRGRQLFFAGCSHFGGRMDGGVSSFKGRLFAAFAFGQVVACLFHAGNGARRCCRAGKVLVQPRRVRLFFGRGMAGRALSGYALAVSRRRSNACLCRQHGGGRRPDVGRFKNSFGKSRRVRARLHRGHALRRSRRQRRRSVRFGRTLSAHICGSLRRCRFGQNMPFCGVRGADCRRRTVCLFADVSACTGKGSRFTVDMRGRLRAFSSSCKVSRSCRSVRFYRLHGGGAYNRRVRMHYVCRYAAAIHAKRCGGVLYKVHLSRLLCACRGGIAQRRKNFARRQMVAAHSCLHPCVGGGDKNITGIDGRRNEW